MKRWYYIEDCTSSRSEIYSEILTAETATAAFIEAAGKWARLTRSDWMKRDEAYIGYADTDENGCMDYDSMTDIYYIKRDGKTVYYMYYDADAYGSQYPVCSDAVETARMIDEGWQDEDSDDPFAQEWHEASDKEMEWNGTYDGTTGESRPGKRETENE